MSYSLNSNQVALVSGLDVSGYGITRSLGRAGISVFALCTPKSQFGRFSRHSAGWFPYPPAPEDHSAQVCELLLKVREQFDAPPVLFATSDWFTQILCENQALFADHYLYHWLPRALLETIVDKSGLADWCLQVGVTIPQTRITLPGEDVHTAAQEFSYPCLVKPNLRTNVFFREAKNFLAASPAELINLYAQHPDLLGSTLWQQYIPGGDENIFQCTALVRRSGDLGGLVTVRKLAQYPANGMMCFGRTEEHPALEQTARRLLERLDYRGLASLEFKYSPHDGRFYFIEINARLPWYNSLFADAGVNLPALAFAELTGEPAPSPLPIPRDRTHWMCVENHLKTVLRESPRPSSSWMRILADVGITQSFAWLDWQDPLPFLAAEAHLLWRTAKKLNPLHLAQGPASLSPRAGAATPDGSAQSDEQGHDLTSPERVSSQTTYKSVRDRG